MKKIIILLLILIVIIGFFLTIFYIKESKVIEQINNFEECAKNGFPIMESYPRQCKTPDNRIFTEEIDKNNKEYLIVVDTPKPQASVSSPLVITGKARGNWFFEASFPLELLDSEGNTIAMGYAMTADDWMTTEFVTFKGTLEFKLPSTEKGILILHKDNPSGLPENNDEIIIPVTFKKLADTNPPESPLPPLPKCMITGCSGQICSDKEVMTSCEFLPQYACYDFAVCKRQPNEECGWTETEEFNTCMNNL